MLHVPVAKNSDAASTVTDLISSIRPPGTKSFSLSYQRNISPTCRAKKHNSSTTLLRNYIREYDRSQTWDLAEALTQHVHLKPSLDENKEIAKEISYAKSLLGTTDAASADEDIQSLTTDDLLTMDAHGASMSHIAKISSCPTMLDLDCKKHSTINSIPSHRMRTSSQKTESSNSMRFSEIASANFFSRASSESTLTDSNLYSLNGVNYTPHSIKYKSMFKKSQSISIDPSSKRTSHSEISQSEPVPRSDLSESNLDMFFETVNKSSDNCLTAHAGRTPYKSCRPLIQTSYDPNDQALENIENSGTSPKSEFSSSYYSVPIHLNSRTPAMREFMETCLDKQSDKSDVPRSSGSVETLKNMLFTLQGISSTDSCSARQIDVCAETELGELQDGPSSLKKAISHLSNLKDLLA